MSNIWHPPNEAHTLCHVCGRSGCSPSVCNPHPTCKVDDRLNKLLMLVLDVIIRIHANHVINPLPAQDRDPSLDPVIIRPHPDSTITNNIQSSNNNTNSRNNANSSSSIQSPHTLYPNSSTFTSLSNNPNCMLPQHIIDELKAQIEKIANTLNTLETTVS
ncbi:hypothetical protein RhiirC2_801160 [Rhizophagus irregularis]|uniref:Uncharacterized protein n=1 Tax=Rhizophagus irregularis TaxID=588596 RepID=A0A2N1M2W2_9GLOM|nr:hypothetical protein RhiirC2_801160 [Rhizophagus irregularis]